MQIVADENIPLVAEFFADMGAIKRVPGRNLDRAQLGGAELLLVRSVTQVDKALLAGSKVRFVASATIGTDHIDHDYLAEQGIGFANAPGCNAESVVDYVVSALLNLCEEKQQSLNDRIIGIVGVGNVGSRLQHRLQGMGCQLLLNDPPRAENEQSDAFVSLDQLLKQADIICMHTPLTRSGSHPSYHLLNENNLATLKPGSWLINAGRGGAIDNRALSQLLERRDDLCVILDVWEDEPGIDLRLAEQVHWGTPHIAGYSVEGRSRGTEMIYQRACEYFNLPVTYNLHGLLPPGPVISGELGSQKSVDYVNQVYDLREDHLRLKKMLESCRSEMDQVRTGFDRLRKEYPARRELGSSQLDSKGVPEELAGLLLTMGFTLS